MFVARKDEIRRIRARPSSDAHSLYSAIRQKAAWRSWMGRAFEILCRQHALEIAGLLGLSGIEYDFGPWFRAPKQGHSGVQIDLALDRADQVITLCEMKRQTAPVGQSIIPEVGQKATVLESVCPGKTIQKVLVVDAPVSRELQRAGYFYKIIIADQLIAFAS